MPEHDCGLCNLLIKCGGHVGKEQLQTLIARLLCEGVDSFLTLATEFGLTKTQLTELEARVAALEAGPDVNLLMTEPFDNSVAPWWTEVEPVSPVFVVSPKFEGSHSAEYKLIGDGGDEQQPLSYYRDGLDLDEFYAVWYELYLTGWEFAVGQKLMRWGNVNGAPGPYYQTTMLIFNDPLIDPYISEGIYTQHYSQPDGGGPAIDLEYYWNGLVPVNGWNQFRWHQKLNTPGSSDGFEKVWFNDALILDNLNLNLRGDIVENIQFHQYGMNATFQGVYNGGNGPQEDIYRYFDHMRVWDGDPGIF